MYRFISVLYLFLVLCIDFYISQYVTILVTLALWFLFWFGCWFSETVFLFIDQAGLTTVWLVACFVVGQWETCRFGLSVQGALAIQGLLWFCVNLELLFFYFYDDCFWDVLSNQWTWCFSVFVYVFSLVSLIGDDVLSFSYRFWGVFLALSCHLPQPLGSGDWTQGFVLDFFLTVLPNLLLMYRSATDFFINVDFVSNFNFSVYKIMS